MKVAIEGCCHGELDKIYATIEHMQKVEGITVDLLLICGDFQAIRNEADMDCLSCPPKYRQLGTFWEYYTGLKTAPIPTVFIGGNHEASNYLTELYHGGWVCKNIYYLGTAGVINFGGLRIGGISGIYKREDFFKGHHETPPYTAQDLRSVYHVRRYDVEKLLQIKQPLDIFLSHDWPRGIEQHGDVHALLRKKPFFRDEVRTNTLGSPVNEDILKSIKPKYWFSAHLHVKFAAIVRHSESLKHHSFSASRSVELNSCPSQQTASVSQNPDEIVLDEELSPIEIVTNPDEIVLEEELNNILTKNPDEIPLDEAMDLQNSEEIILDKELGIMEISNPKEIQPLDVLDNTATLINTVSARSDSTVEIDTYSSKTEEECPVESTLDINEQNKVRRNVNDESYIMKNPDEINLDYSDGDLEVTDDPLQPQSIGGSSYTVPEKLTSRSSEQPQITKFLSLDKCLPRRDFLQVIDIPSDSNIPKEFRYDPEWLAITKSTQEYLTLSRYQTPIPDRHTLSLSVEENVFWVQKNLDSDAIMIPDNFEVVAPPYSPTKSLALHSAERVDLQRVFHNPQTEAFCKLIQVENKIAKLAAIVVDEPYDPEAEMFMPVSVPPISTPSPSYSGLTNPGQMDTHVHRSALSLPPPNNTTMKDVYLP